MYIFSQTPTLDNDRKKITSPFLPNRNSSGFFPLSFSCLAILYFFPFRLRYTSTCVHVYVCGSWIGQKDTIYLYPFSFKWPAGLDFFFFFFLSTIISSLIISFFCVCLNVLWNGWASSLCRRLLFYLSCRYRRRRLCTQSSPTPDFCYKF